MYDAIIIGGGPAGLAAALPLGRSHRSVLLLDAGEGRNASAAAVHNFLGQDGTPPAELRRIGREQLGAYPGVELREASVASARRVGEGFALVLRGGETVSGRRLVLATGLADDLPQTPGLAEIWGRSAYHCPYCHGYEASGLRLAVIGVSPEKVRLALQLGRFTDDLVLCADGGSLEAEQLDLLAEHGIEVRREPVIRYEAVEGKLERIVLESGAPLERDAIFVQSAPRQSSALAEMLGCELLPDGGVEVDDFAKTSVPGVLAAGDMAHRAALPMPFAAVGWAAASGMIAGVMVDQELLTEDFKLPSPMAMKR